MAGLDDFEARTGVSLHDMGGLDALDDDDLDRLASIYLQARDQQDSQVSEALDRASKIVPKPFRKQAVKLLFGSGRR